MAQDHRARSESPSQTAGPYVHIGCAPNFAGLTGVYPDDLGASMMLGPVKGEKIALRGTIYDGTGLPLRDAMIEAWQADGDGRYPPDAVPNFTGWGRSTCDAETGEFAFDTVKPGRVRWPDGRLQAPHITLWIVARGVNLGLHTRAYFADEEAANAEDPILTRIEHRSRVPTLLATSEADGLYRFNIHLQGPEETIFFDI